MENNYILRYKGKDKKSSRYLREALVGITKLKYYKTKTVCYIFPGILYDIPYARISSSAIYIDGSIFEKNDREALEEYLAIYGECQFEESDIVEAEFITGEDNARRNAEDKGYKYIRRKVIPRFKNN